jgi:ATP-binding cassette, subfamily F, member 3
MSIKGSKMNLAFGVEIIYEDADFLLNDHDKVGIVGVNGAGKTTLFRLLLGCLRLDSGTITCGKARIGYLPQELVIEHEDCTVEEYLKSGRPIGKLEIELEQIYIALETLDASQQAILLKRMAKVQEQLEYYECYEADTILQNLVENMQITSELMNMRMVELSGGQKSKMAFAQLLYSKPEILLLDEPTNHLDASTKEYVTAYLKQYQGMVLIISHDIDFLDQVTDITMFLDKMTHKTYMYDGNYTTYKKKHAAEQLARERLITQQENEIKELSDFVKRARAATITNHAIHRLGQVRAKTLEKKKEALQTRVKAYKRVKMDIRPKREGALVPLEVTNLSFCYPGQKNLYRDLSFQIKGGERFLVVGENGIGKSTLLKLLMRILTPEAGEIRYNSKTDIGYYAQELEQLDLSKTVLENVDTPDYSPWQLRSVLSNFLFYDDDVNKELAVLSPGEKARVALCKVLLQKANLLLLDEPTNHLDPETQAIIGGNFHEYTGTIIVVSHNPAFVEQIGISRMLL